MEKIIVAITYDEPDHLAKVNHGSCEQKEEFNKVSHITQQEFVRIVADINQRLIRNSKVLEIGSYDVNGSIRSIFNEAELFVGVDLVEGPGVDVVSYGHTVDLPWESFDVALSCECFEHDPYWESTFKRMIELTRPGGLVLFTCAGWARPEHGTERISSILSPGTQGHGLDYYRNLTARDVTAAVDLGSHFSTWGFGYQPDFQDLYFAGVRNGSSSGLSQRARIPTRHQVAQIADLVPESKKKSGLRRRLVRSFLTESAYQDAIFLTFHASRPYIKQILPQPLYKVLKKWRRR